MTSRFGTFLVVPLVMAAVLASRPVSMEAQAAAGFDPARRQTTHAASRAAVDDFTTNGCTFFPDDQFYSCCFAHDWEHWAGGTKADRWRSDVALRRCVIDLTGGKSLANIVYSGVRLARLPGAVFGDGWARAWRKLDRGRYAPLSMAELLLLREKTERVCAALTLNFETGRYQINGGRSVRASDAQIVCPAKFGTPDARMASVLP